MKKTFDSVLADIKKRSDRDPQQKLVYKSEDRASDLYGVEKLNPVTCRMLANDIQESKELSELYPLAMEERFKIVLKGNCETSAYAFMGTIFLPKWAHTNWVLCHEVAHIVETREYGDEEEEGDEAHGPRFCSILIDIVRCVISPEASAILKKCYGENGVEYY